jgi:hypothetical protein
MKRLLLFFFTIPAFCESLHYAINWPSGLSLGEATLETERGGEKTNGQWNLSLSIDASIPGFAVRDDDKSIATAELCSIEFDKTFAHGQHRNQETLKFDQQTHEVTRQTAGGGKSEISVDACARDPLAFLQYLRRELAEGRLPPQQQVVYGAVYEVRVEYKGKQSIRVGEQNVEAERIAATIKGPSSNLNVEIFFAQDAVRTPLEAKIPLALGTFSLELQK